MAKSDETSKKTDVKKKDQEVKENSKVNFDLSTLTLSELVELYEKVTSFQEFLEGARIEEDKKEDN